MRYILLFSDGTIHIGVNDLRSGYCVWSRRGWRAAVHDLAVMVSARNQGKITSLEIQSHGEYGRIIMPTKPDITNDDVEGFGASLKPMMSTGGMIEIMACKVAGFSRRTLAPEKGKNQYAPEVIDEYIGGMEKDPMMIDSERNYLRISGSLLDNYMQRMQEARSSYMEPQDNGLQFCLTLARTTACTVRAARLVQAEEAGDIYFFDGKIREKPHPIMRDFDHFGDWEGPVWDFMPNGSVKYLGCNLPRHRLRFPVHEPAGPRQLTYNFREQGGQNASVGQRPQRMNRSSLPA